MTERFSDSPEARFVGLMSELFQLREAEELDFGIYRVIKRHNQQMREFLSEIVEEQGQPVLRGGELAGILEQAFSTIENATRQEKKIELQRLAEALGVKAHFAADERGRYLAGVEQIPAMRQQVMDYRNLREELETTYSASADRSEVLNRLYEFFSRHYQDGDFIVQRRYGRNGSRYIKSSGEDTEFHWATEDLYYIKSGDVFTDYPVRLSNGRRLLFCVDAETLQQTRAELKPTDKASYKLRAIVQDSPRSPGEVPGERALDSPRPPGEGPGERASFRVILDYVKGAQKARAQLEEIVTQAAALTQAPLEEIAQHLRRYAARNQSDFFIHQRLQEALDDDLDIFVKTDVLNAEQLLADDAGQIPARALRVARVIRNVGRRINAFLGVLEDFQKRLWEKKKLVLSTRYVITLDRLDKLAGRAFVEANLAAILANAAQTAEWQALGLGERATAEAVRRQDSGFLPLPIDTLHFDENFKWALLAAVTKEYPLDESLDGVAIHSDNWQALNTMQDKYGEQVKCVYIDPPYNTGGDGFPYKDAFQHASWMAMISDRLDMAVKLIQRSGALFASIDANERQGLEVALNHTFGRQNRVEEIIWVQNSTKSQSPTYSNNHEYVEVYCRNLETVKRDEKMFREPKPGYAEVMELVESLNSQYPSIVEIRQKITALFKQHEVEFRDELEEQGIEYDRALDPWKGLYNYRNAEYRDESGCLVSESDAKVRKAQIWIWREDNPSMPLVSAGSQKASVKDSNDPNYRFYTPLHPNTGKPCKPPKRGWVWPRQPLKGFSQSFEEMEKDNRIAWGDDEIQPLCTESA